MTTHPYDHNRTKATLADVNHRDGPYWADYQSWRKRYDIVHNPDTVPDFWLRERVRDQIHEARVVVERTALPGDLPITEAERLKDVFHAFVTVSNFLATAGTDQFGSEAADEVNAVLLGGLDLALERERVWDKLRGSDDATLEEFAAFDPDIQRKLIAEASKTDVFVQGGTDA